MKNIIRKNNDKGKLKEAFDRKLDEALNAQKSGDMSKSQQLMKESQQIFVQWLEEARGA